MIFGVVYYLVNSVNKKIVGQRTQRYTKIGI